VVCVLRAGVLGVKPAAHPRTVVGIKDSQVEQAAGLVATGHGAEAGRRAASVLVQRGDVEEAGLVSTAGHCAGKRAGQRVERGDEG